MTAAVAIHSTEVGEAGAPVVFLHGLFGQGRNFTRIAKALQPAYRSLLVDLPNHGRSAWTETFSYAETADLVADELHARVAAAGPVHLVGHSLGGKVAMSLALRHPEMLDRLVVVDIAPGPSDGASEFEHLLDTLAGLDLASLRRRADAEDQLRNEIPNDGVRAFLLQNLRSQEDGFVWQANLAMLRRELVAIGDFPTYDAAFEHPVLWVAGERSDYITADDATVMRSLFPRTTLVTIRGAGHWVHSEQPEAFVSALQTFLGAARD